MAKTLAPMYCLKPVLEPNSVFYYNTTMYGMKTIVESTASATHNMKTGSINSTDETYEELERSQQVLFSYIGAIKKQVQELTEILLKRRNNFNEKVNLNEMNLNKTITKHEVVINADINQPPYSLLALHHLTKESLSYNILSHHHSSLNNLPKNLEIFNKILNKNGGQLLDIRLIWKNGGGTSVVFGYVPLSGEVSLLRFVHSLLNLKFDPSIETKLQELLDQLNNDGASSFESIVNGTEYIIMKKLTVVDLALWSALKTMKPSTNLQKWFLHFDKILSN